MKADLQKLPSCLFWGGVWGTAAWSAYAVVEFAFSSLIFRFTRPYAVFSGWHWQLTGLLVLAYLIVGAVTGAFAGLLVHLVRQRLADDTNPLHALEFAATLPVTLALMGNGIFITFSNYGYKGLYESAVAALGTGLLLAGILSGVWANRAGLLTNAWIVCGLILGFGEEFELFNMGVAAQLGSPIAKAALTLGVMLLLAAVLAVLVGRSLRQRLLAGSGAHIGLAAATIAAGLALFGISALRGFAGSTPVTAEAASDRLSTSERPNVVLIVMDTVRADHLSVYGYKRDTTPNLRALAQDSVAYANAISTSDITLTSHASLFTGMYASWHSAYCQPPEAWYGRRLSDNYPTVAELLKKNGYETIGVAANLYLRADFGLERGFNEFRIPRPVPLLPDESHWLLRHPVRKVLSHAADTTQFDRLYTMGEDIDTELFHAVENRAHPEAPFFVFVNYMDAHFPYVPPAPFTERYPGRHRHTTQEELELQQYSLSAGKPEPSYVEHSVSQYDGGIAYVDAQVGRVIAWLKSRKAYDNTMIIVTSDHGESFGERNRTTHANGPYQNLLHVVLMVKYPKSSLRGPEQDFVSLTDVAPTILTAANIPVPSTMQGRNLADRSAPAREIYSETFPCPVIQPIQCPHGCTTTSVYRWPYKLIQSTEHGGKFELFDLATDPAETRNLFVRNPDSAATLRTQIDTWNRPVQTRETKQMDIDKEKGLRDLGYAIGK
jgi:arylsulfatase A-like enzyme